MELKKPKSKKVITVLLLVAVTMMMGSKFFNSVKSNSAPTIVRVISEIDKVGPGNMIGQNFTIGIVIENVTELWAFAVKIRINQTYFEYVEHTATVPVEDYPDPIPPSPYAGILHGEPAAVTQVRDEYDPGTGILEVAYSTTSPSPPFNGSGTVCTVTLQVIHQPIGQNVTVISEFVETKLAGYGIPPPPILHDAQDFEIEVYGLPQPAGPTIRVENYSHRGEIPHSFNLNISILNLDEYWDLLGFDLKMAFVPEIIQISNISLGNFSRHFNLTSEAKNVIDNKTGSVWVAYYWNPAAGTRIIPSGNGTLVTLEIEANGSKGLGQSPVVFTQVKLAASPHPERSEDPFNNQPYSVPIYHISLGGVVEIIEVKSHVITEYPELPIITESNSTVTLAEFNTTIRMLRFEVKGIPDTLGFINITLPLNLMWPVDTFTVYVDGWPVPFELSTNATHAFVYLTYSHSIHSLMIMSREVIPELSSLTILALLLTLTSIILLGAKRLK